MPAWEIELKLKSHFNVDLHTDIQITRVATNNSQFLIAVSSHSNWEAESRIGKQATSDRIASDNACTLFCTQLH